MKITRERINVTKSFLPPIDEYKTMIESIWESNWVTNNGPLHQELEEELAKYLNVEYSTLFTNGHLALDSALKLMNLNGEVITTPFTFASTTHAIVMNGLKPVFCDINLEDYTIDVNQIESLINENTVAIVPVHVFGYPCNIDKIEAIAKKYNLKVIYDSAHAFGVKVDDKGIGGFGDISMFSLHATKVYNSIEGGLLTYNNKENVNKLNEIKNFGITGPETVNSVGLNAKMNEFQAAMGLVNLNHIDEQIAKREVITKLYREQLKDVAGISYIDDIKGVKHNYAYLPVLIDEAICGVDRDTLHIKLQKYNIFSRKYFYPLITDFDCYKGKYESKHLKNAKYVSDRVLTLPIYGSLTEVECIYVCDAIKEILNKR